MLEAVRLSEPCYYVSQPPIFVGVCTSRRSLYDINEPPSGDGKVDRTELNLLQYQQLKADINKTNQTCSALLFGYLFLQTPEVSTPHLAR